LTVGSAIHLAAIGDFADLTRTAHLYINAGGRMPQPTAGRACLSIASGLFESG